MRRLIACLTVFLAAGSAVPAEPFVLKAGQRIVFLGDSNTFAGRFIMLLDGFLATRFPDQRFDLINLGLPSETVTGLSEPEHPYPRPNIHERIDRALHKTKPNVVVICYGMNDGIYHPFSEERFQKYQEGMRSLIKKCRDAGAFVIVHTPAPFDPVPLGDKAVPKTADKFSWMRPYEKYDDVLTRYSEWLMTLRKEGMPVVNPHSAILAYLKKRRATEPRFTVSRDGIHPDANGHWFIARELLRVLNAPAVVEEIDIGLQDNRVAEEIRRRLHVDNGVVEFRMRGAVPMPHDSGWENRLIEMERIGAIWNRCTIRIRGAANEKYELFEGDKRVAMAARAEMEKGIDLTTLKELSVNRRAAEVWKLIEQRQRLLGLAWLTDVGHHRPDTPKGIALSDAQKQASDIDAKIRDLATPKEYKLRFVPAK